MYMGMYDDGQKVVFPTSELSETVASVLKSFIYRSNLCAVFGLYNAF